MIYCVYTPTYNCGAPPCNLVNSIDDNMNTYCQYRTLLHHQGKDTFDAEKHKSNPATWAWHGETLVKQQMVDHCIMSRMIPSSGVMPTCSCCFNHLE